MCIKSLVVRTNDPALTAIVAAACRILGLGFPGNMPVEVTEERIDADPEMLPTLEDLLTRLNNMWVPWAKLATPQHHNMLDRLLPQFRNMAPVWQPPTQPTPSELPTVEARALQLVALP